MKLHRAACLLAILVHASARAQKPNAPVATAEVNRVAVLAFEKGATVLNSSSPFILQDVSVSWSPYPMARHRVQRAGTSKGPWVTIHDIPGAADSLIGLPPSTTFYLRVLALVEHGISGYALVDSTPPVMIQTGAAVTHNLPAVVLRCSVRTDGRFQITWPATHGFTTYVITPYVTGHPSPDAHNASQWSAEHAIVVTDTKLTYAKPKNFTALLRGQARADFTDWPGPGQTYSYETPLDWQAYDYVVASFNPLQGGRCSP